MLEASECGLLDYGESGFLLFGESDLLDYGESGFFKAIGRIKTDVCA